MTVIVIISTLTFSAVVGMGFYVFLTNPDKRVNRTFLVMTFFLGMLCLCSIMIQMESDQEQADRWYRLGTSFSYLGFILTVLVSVYLSKLEVLRYWVYTLIIPAAYLIYRTMTLPEVVHYAFYRNSWRVTGIASQRHLYESMAFYFILTLLNAACLTAWLRGTSSIREKKQASVLLVSFLCCGTMNVLYMVFAFDQLKLVPYQVPGDAVFIYLIWVMSLAYCITRYRLLRITPEYVNSEILRSIDESIILLDHTKKIIAANDKTKTLVRKKKIEGGGLSQIVDEHALINREIETLFSGNGADFSCRLHFLSEDGNRVYMDAKASLVKDRYDDILGVLIISREVKELAHLRQLYRITARETEIIQGIIDGYTNSDIAAGLDISENTLKRHVSNIYNKMGINNKIELFKLLKDFNLMPLMPAEKTVLVAARPK